MATAAVPNATLAPTPIPTVPSPFTVINVQASNDTSSGQTALYSVLRIIGTGVTPFDLERQSILLTALGYVISSVDLSKMYITDVNPVFASRRRQLLMEAHNQQVNLLHYTLLLHFPLSSLPLSPWGPQTLPSTHCCCYAFNADVISLFFVFCSIFGWESYLLHL